MIYNISKKIICFIITITKCYNNKKEVQYMSQTVNINFRMDEDLKKTMEKVCADMAFPW